MIWSILALYNQAQVTEKKGPEEISLDLVKKMLHKAVSEGRLKSFQDYCLCMLLPTKDPAFMSMLSSIPENIFPTSLDSTKWKAQVLFHQKAHASLVEYCKSMKDPTMM